MHQLYKEGALAPSFEQLEERLWGKYLGLPLKMSSHMVKGKHWRQGQHEALLRRHSLSIATTWFEFQSLPRRVGCLTCK